MYTWRILQHVRPTSPPPRPREAPGHLGSFTDAKRVHKTSRELWDMLFLYVGSVLCRGPASNLNGEEPTTSQIPTYATDSVESRNEYSSRDKMESITRHHGGMLLRIRALDREQQATGNSGRASQSAPTSTPEHIACCIALLKRLCLLGSPQQAAGCSEPTMRMTTSMAMQLPTATRTRTKYEQTHSLNMCQLLRTFELYYSCF